MTKLVVEQPGYNMSVNYLQFQPIPQKKSLKYNFNLGIKYSSSWIGQHGYTSAGSAFLGAVLSLPVWQIRICLRAADTNSVPGFSEWFD